jgi:uncharacterized protein (DUF305 family)
MSLAARLGGQRARLIWAALVAVLLVGVGYAAGVLVPRLTSPGNDSAEAGFAWDMSIHHSQAVRMSFLEYRAGENSTVRLLAYDIGTSQQYQIGVMETWLKEWHLPLTSDRGPMAWLPEGSRALQADGRMPGLASPEEMKRLEAANRHEADVLFCQLMLRHHLGGLHMVDEVLKRTDRAEVRELALAMRNGQQSDVEALRQLLKELDAAQ